MGLWWSATQRRTRDRGLTGIIAIVDIEARVREVLSATGVEYELIEIDPELADTAAFCAYYGYPEEKSGNAILVASSIIRR